MLDGLTGTVNEGSVAGDINAVVKDGKPHLTGQLTLDELNLEPLAAMVLGESALESTGNGWSSVPFAAESYRAVQRRTRHCRRDAVGRAGGDRLRRKPDAEARRREPAGSPTSPAKLFGGDVTGLFELKNNDGTGLFSGQMKLSGADIASILGDAGLKGVGRLIDRAFGERQVGRRAGRHAFGLGNRGVPLAGRRRRQSAGVSLSSSPAPISSARISTRRRRQASRPILPRRAALRPIRARPPSRSRQACCARRRWS